MKGAQKMSEKIIAPMPGRIVSIAVKKGEKVTEDSLILVLEAMKMENNIFCSEDGTIKDVFVKEGDTVNTADVMVVLE